MNSSMLGLVELLLVLGAVVAFCVYELVALRLLERREKDLASEPGLETDKHDPLA